MAFKATNHVLSSFRVGLHVVAFFCKSCSIFCLIVGDEIDRDVIH